jgi:hypothetical protein
VVWEPNPDSYQDEYKITYYELETFNGDSSSVVVSDTYFSLSNLQPGRNYSLSISAVSQGIESVERSIFQATSKLFTRREMAGKFKLHYSVLFFCVGADLFLIFLILF